MPFVQGLLRKEDIVAWVDTFCACCGRAMQLEIDSQMNYRVLVGGKDILLFVPLVNFDKLEDPSIIDAF